MRVRPAHRGLILGHGEQLADGHAVLDGQQAHRVLLVARERGEEGQQVLLEVCRLAGGVQRDGELAEVGRCGAADHRRVVAAELGEEAARARARAGLGWVWWCRSRDGRGAGVRPWAPAGPTSDGSARAIPTRSTGAPADLASGRTRQPAVGRGEQPGGRDARGEPVAEREPPDQRHEVLEQVALAQLCRHLVERDNGLVAEGG